MNNVLLFPMPRGGAVTSSQRENIAKATAELRENWSRVSELLDAGAHSMVADQGAVGQALDALHGSITDLRSRRLSRAECSCRWYELRSVPCADLCTRSPAQRAAQFIIGDRTQPWPVNVTGEGMADWIVAGDKGSPACREVRASSSCRIERPTQGAFPRRGALARARGLLASDRGQKGPWVGRGSGRELARKCRLFNVSGHIGWHIRDI